MSKSIRLFDRDTRSVKPTLFADEIVTYARNTDAEATSLTRALVRRSSRSCGRSDVEGAGFVRVARSHGHPQAVDYAYRVGKHRMTALAV